MANIFRNTSIKLGDGEKIDLKDFFDTYYPVFNSFAAGYISDPAICEDIVQEVFISFWEKQKTFLNINAVKPFFYTSIKNACFDFLRHAKVVEKHRGLSKNKSEETESFLEEVIKKETYSEIYKEINKLPAMAKKVLLLSLREKSNEEIAKILNIAINTVKTHKSRAYKVLRENLSDLFLFFFPLKKYIHRS